MEHVRLVAADAAPRAGPVGDRRLRGGVVTILGTAAAAIGVALLGPEAAAWRGLLGVPLAIGAALLAVGPATLQRRHRGPGAAAGQEGHDPAAPRAGDEQRDAEAGRDDDRGQRRLRPERAAGE